MLQTSSCCFVFKLYSVKRSYWPWKGIFSLNSYNCEYVNFDHLISTSSRAENCTCICNVCVFPKAIAWKTTSFTSIKNRRNIHKSIHANNNHSSLTMHFSVSDISGQIPVKRLWCNVKNWNWTGTQNGSTKLWIDLLETTFSKLF
jgi:hypothetical protein